MDQSGKRKLSASRPGLQSLNDEGQGMLFELPKPVPPLPKFRSPQLPVWTEMKGSLVAAYLKLFIMVTHSGTYIDLFAGPQDLSNPGSWAARRVLEIKPEWLRHFHLIDVTELQISQLKRMRREIGRDRDIQIYSGDCNAIVDDILRPWIIREKEPTFALADQRCFECRWETLERLAAYKSGHKIELLYFMPEGWLDRSLAAASRPETILEIDQWWGRPTWGTEIRGITGAVRARVFVDRFRDELGYKHVTAWPISSRENGGRTMYFMIHASDHDEAPRFMARAYNKTCVPINRLQQTSLKV